MIWYESIFEMFYVEFRIFILQLLNVIITSIRSTLLSIIAWIISWWFFLVFLFLERCIFKFPI